MLSQGRILATGRFYPNLSNASPLSFKLHNLYRDGKTVLTDQTKLPLSYTIFTGTI